MSWSIIEDIEGIYARRRHGSLHEFTVSRWTTSGADTEYVLRNYGIPLYLRNVIDERAYFSVPESQATWAEFIMCGRGVAVLTPLRKPYHRFVYEKAIRGEPTIPEAWGPGIKAKSFSGRFVDVILGQMGYRRPTVPQQSPQRGQRRATTANKRRAQRQRTQRSSATAVTTPTRSSLRWIPWVVGLGAAVLIALEQGGVL